MPDSGAVYQPTTVGYSYDTRVGGFLGVSVSRPKVHLKKWLEWALISAAVSIFAAGLLVTIIDLASGDSSELNCNQESKSMAESPSSNVTKPITNQENSDPSLIHKNQDGGDNSSGRTIAVGVTLIVVGIVLGLLWSWLRFFRRNESPRNDTSGGGGQMLGGLNPSTDLLVGSPSQYGPVLTEVPSHPKSKQAGLNHQITAATLSDQEEETRTLMQEPANFSPSSNNPQENQHPG